MKDPEITEEEMLMYKEFMDEAEAQQLTVADVMAQRIVEKF